MEKHPIQELTGKSEPEQILQRKKNLERLLEAGINPFGERFKRTCLISEIIEKHQGLSEGQVGEATSIAGRLMAQRGHGKASFGNIQDQSGKIQVYFKNDTLGQSYELLKYIDTGDILGIEGKIFKTKRGELTVWADSFKVLSKCLIPLPEKWHGLKDVELRYRQRYIDLIVNEEVRENIIKRSKIISYIRNLLEERGYIEVETPVMSSVAGGATARPFITHHNALDLDLYLRIATELYLKRCIVGGLEKVYEIGRIFRNEGISTKHNPEFTMLELYEAYGDYQTMIEIAEDIISGAAKELNGSFEIQYQGKTISLKPPFERITMNDALKKYGDINLGDLRDIKYAKEAAEKFGIDIKDNETNIAHFMDKIFEAVVEPHLVQPTFILDYPIELSPLAKKKNDDPSLTYRFELFIHNSEIVNAFSELNDPADQKERFEEQLKLKEAGAEETHPMDEDFIRALEYGMPPTGGLGIGIDRLVMLLTDSSCIRDVILFPLMKPK